MDVKTPTRTIVVTDGHLSCAAGGFHVSPPLTVDEAAQLHEAFQRDALLLASGVPGVWVHLIRQIGADLLRTFRLPPVDSQCLIMMNLILPEEGALLLISSATPTLPVEYLEQAFEALESGAADVVVGPTGDGSCYLIGVRATEAESLRLTRRRRALTVDRLLKVARPQRLQVMTLPEWGAVTAAAGLERLVYDLAREPALRAPATRVALQSLRHAGAALPAPELPWQLLATTAVHDTPWRTLYSDHLRLPDGTEIDYSYFRADDAVWLVPVTTDGEIVLIRQYRHPLRDWTLELPAGGADGGPLEEVAARELREEVGGMAGELRFMGSFYGAVAHGSLRRNVFLALDVTLGKPEHEPTERIVTLTVPAALAFDMARRGEINDGESALALLYCEHAVWEHLARNSE